MVVFRIGGAGAISKRHADSGGFDNSLALGYAAAISNDGEVAWELSGWANYHVREASVNGHFVDASRESGLGLASVAVDGGRAQILKCAIKRDGVNEVVGLVALSSIGDIFQKPAVQKLKWQ
jgi:hypothetical protein